MSVPKAGKPLGNKCVPVRCFCLIDVNPHDPSPVSRLSLLKPHLFVIESFAIQGPRKAIYLKCPVGF